MELGPRDLVLNSAGRRHWFRNNSTGHVTVWQVIGTAQPETVRGQLGTEPADP